MEKKKLNVLMGVLAACILIVAAILGVRLISRSSDSGTEGYGVNGKDTTVSGSDTYIEPVTEIEIPDDGMYSIEVKTEGNMFFEGIGVYIYTDKTMEELVWFDKTDENGIAEFTAEDATGYVAVLQDMPEGYEIQEYYYITGAKTEIVLGTALKEGVDLSEISYSLGDVIHDFSVTTPDGEVYTVSEILEEKKAIILNFWYVQCGPCKEEFPHMGEAYAEYKDKIEILAMNPVNLDDDEIAKYIKDMGIKFPMMQCEEEWATALGITAYPTTVVIDRYGVISLMHTGSLPDAEIFKQLFEFYSADDYEQTVVEDIYDIVTAELSQGTMDNPFELGGILDFEITVRPDQVIYFNMYRVDKMNVRIEDPDAYAIYEEKTYYPDNGVVGFKVSCPDTYTPAFVGIGNAGTEKKTFHVTLGADAGTYENPYALKLGEFTASVSAGNDQGVFYEYRATKTGALTLQCLSASKGVKYSYYLQNMRTSENRNLEYDGVTDSDGNVTVSINVQKGDRVLVCISTLPDSSGSYPSGTFKMKASLGNSIAKDEQYYSVSVVDDSLKPVGGVSVKLICQGIETIEGVDDSKDEDAMTVGKEISLSTDTKGVASRKLRIGEYKAVLTIPPEYKADTTEYVLTKDEASIAFMLNKIEIKYVDYEILVLDNETGKPIKNALVEIGEKEADTDANGIAKIKLPEGKYNLSVFAEGYAGKAYELKVGETNLTVRLDKGTDDSEADKVDYKVTVKYRGTSPSGLSEEVEIYFKFDGVLVKREPETITISKQNPQASITIQLPKKAYTVELKFEDGSSLRTYTSDLTMPEEGGELIVEVGNAVDASIATLNTVYITTTGESENIYPVKLGANPIINMSINEYTYFEFEPEEKGIYRISSNNINAQISFWSGTTMSGVTLDIEKDYTGNAFEMKVLGVGPSYVMALKGAATATITISRVGDVEEEKPYIIYEPITTPVSGKYTGGTKTYFDKGAATDAYKLVYNSSDKYYHLGSETGSIIYVNLNHPTISLSNLVSNQKLINIIYDADGKILEKWDYTECVLNYVSATSTGFYPMTQDLMTIIKNGGGYMGWWNEDSYNYMFEGEEVNPDVAWLFFCCY